MTKITKLSALIALFIIPAAMAGENPHCVTSTDSYGITTIQCDNGMVTITNGSNKTATICTGGNGYSIDCKELKL